MIIPNTKPLESKQDKKMSDKVKTNVTVSFPLFGLLFLLFTGLKLTGHITWSWWWVTAPLWGFPALLIGLGLLVLVVYLIYTALKK